jgi:peptidoglycan hydrolase CwlO-like protein
VFRFMKRGIQVKGVEQYFEREHRRAEKARIRAARRNTGRVKRFIVAIAVLFIIVVMVLVTGIQQSEISRLKAQRDDEMLGLRERAAALSAELDKSGREVEALKERIVSLDRDLEAERTERARAETALRKSIADRKRTSEPSV